MLMIYGGLYPAHERARSSAVAAAKPEARNAKTIAAHRMASRWTVPLCLPLTRKPSVHFSGINGTAVNLLDSTKSGSFGIKVGDALQCLALKG